ncbi:acetoacetate-CoA ligase [Capronia epimyces CBS 606.96]|uniref:Acetoacetate-CoA ligase n=1 Tax=Capronia epimyces CBS 606.96 TaxID=1182542 RepID=W9YRZ4_9EURO|nr:acetoacetate-CoA ligase [Capronia epimyces CBS 606.96]EXJ92021.1 acetoacetate-CoA ligase [Capronia epimyces CBS 606.96]
MPDNKAVKVLPRKLWEHPDPEQTAMGRFRLQLENEKKVKLPTFDALNNWSVNNRVEFWDFAWRYLNVIHEGTYTTPVDGTASIETNPPWFEGVKVNFAENILFSAGYPNRSPSRLTTHGKEDDKIAATEVREGAVDVHHFTWAELRRRTGHLSQALRAAGVVKGDRIAAVSGNNFQTLVVFLATTALGAIFSSSATDMGVNGVLDRLRQIKPKWVFMDDCAVYNGKTTDLRPRMQSLIDGMADVEEWLGLISLSQSQTPASISHLPKTQSLAQFLSQATTHELTFTRVDFNDPCLIVYSSGTTGPPKCIVHRTGGILLSLRKEMGLHRGFGPQHVQLQYTTTGWIMYLVSTAGLLFGARIVLYDGSVFFPDKLAFIRLLQDQGVTHFGTSPRYMHELQRDGIRPREVADLSRLELVTSTGMVLSDSLFEWFYDQGFPPRVHLANISGGTDIAGTFAMENPLSPVYVGGCQGPSLGVPISIFRQGSGDDDRFGTAVKDGEAGELVATGAFPNMPVTFWGPEGDQKYRAAYFARYQHAWTQGDLVCRHPTTKQIIFLGRSDGVLNPSGIRFGSAEIYNVVEDHFGHLVADSLCVGQRRPRDADESVFLFLLMKPGVPFTPELAKQIKDVVRQKRSARHVPKYIFQTPAIPTTVNLKKAEIPVKQIISGASIQNSGAIANPQSLQFYYQFAEMENMTDAQSKL